MKKLLLLPLAILACTQLSILGAAPDLAPVSDWHNKTLGTALLNSVIFGLLGIILAILGFKLFDKAITRLDLEAEIGKGNLAAAILSGAVIIGICMIIASAIS